MSARLRILVFTGSDPAVDQAVAHLGEIWDVVRASTLQEGLQLLQGSNFDGIFVPAQAAKVWQRAATLLEHEAVLEKLGEGVAFIQPDLRIAWANSTFEKWCGSEVRGAIFYEALGSPTILGPDHSPFHTALLGKSTATRLHRRDNQFLELRISPLFDKEGKVRCLIALGLDVTAEVLQQQKLDALHQAGRELASLQAEQLAAMSVEERIELLKYNIRRLTHDLLHYDVIEIRLLDPRTSALRPLLTEGMTAAASQRVLYASTEGNGVTGYVAATGKTYVCNDATTDPHYLEGAKGARSSLTIALNYGDRVIGTFNVESPQPDSFSPQDVQFTEIFCRELANALYTLDLLLVEKQTTASESIEAINREVAIPVDEILNNATALLERWIGHEEEMADKLKKIISGARSIKESIQKVGEDIRPHVKPLALPGDETPCRLSHRILVVDNDERVRRSAHSILGRLGCIVETARDGKEALTMAKLSKYDAIFADIRLPDMNGYDIFHDLRQLHADANVILLSGFGYDSTHSLVRARQEGLQYILYKPFRVDQLLSVLQESIKAPSTESHG